MTIEFIDTVALTEFPRCELCEEYIQDDSQQALVKAQSGYKTAHKQCIHRVTMAVWSELEARAKANVPLDSPYDAAHTYDPVIRKSLGLDTPQWDRALTAASLLTGGEDETTLDDILSRIDYTASRR